MDDLTEQEQEMLLRALREYSEACEAPALTPDCPFAVKIGPHLRGCGEECMDLLGRHAAPRPARAIELESGLVAHVPVRPRARRPRQVNPKPYDAMEIFISSKESLPIREWNLPALFHGAIEIVTSPPLGSNDALDDRVERIAAIRETIESHELDFVAIVEPELRSRVIGALINQAFRLVDRRGENPEGNHFTDWLPTLTERLEGIAPHSPRWHRQIIDVVLPSLVEWSADAPLSSIINWHIPNALLERSSSSGQSPRDPNGRWIIDRFTKTYLSEWNTDSLRLEWQYLHGEVELPCRAQDMRLREVNEDELSRVMADRLVRYRRDGPSLADRLKPSALEYLREGRHDRAAILFETAIDEDRQDGQAHNNFGFCLIPSDPAAAVQSLDEAIALNWSETPLTEANRVLAAAAAGRITVALDLARDFLTKYRPSDLMGHHYLWDPDDLLASGQPTLVELNDLCEYVEKITAILRRRYSDRREPSASALATPDTP